MKIYLHTLIVGLLMAIGVVYYDPFEWFGSISESVIIHDTHQLHEESMDMQGENVDHQGQDIDHQGQENHIETGVIYEEPFIGIIFSGGIIIPGSGSVYRNEEYGFEIKFPKRWKNYEIHIQKELDYKYREVIHVRFIRPTNSLYSSVNNPISEKYMSGYENIGSIIIYKMEDYIEDVIEYFGDNDDISLEEKIERYGRTILVTELGYNSIYHYSYGAGHDLPGDLYQILGEDQGSSDIINNFRIL